MNLLKTLTVAAFAIAMCGVAQATTSVTVIHIAGSTAYRAPVTCAIINALGGTSCLAAGNNSTLLKAQTGVFANGTVSMTSNTLVNGVGTNNGTATLIVETNWTGSLAGVVDLVANNTALAYADLTDSTNVTSKLTACTIAPFAGGAQLGSGFSTTTAAPEIAMSDAFSNSAAAAVSTAQIASGHPIGGATTGAALATLIKNSTAIAEAGSNATIVGAGTKSGYLGIVPFEWVLGNTGLANAPFTNITQQTANFLIKAGYAPFPLFSPTDTAGGNNNPSDFVYLIGRNEDSGTRIDAFAEPQLGFVQSPIQYLLTFSGGSNTGDIPTPTDFTQIGGSGSKIETINPWPANATLNTEPFINWSGAGGGHGGYAGGGDISSILASTPDETSLLSGVGSSGFAIPEQVGGNVYFIGYLGTADAGGFGTTSIAGGTALLYNGVKCTTANIQSGAYSFWCYEHMYYLKTGTNALTNIVGGKTFADGLANNLSTTFANYSSGGVSAPTTSGAGVLLPPDGTVGTVFRSTEGGGFTLNY